MAKDKSTEDLKNELEASQKAYAEMETKNKELSATAKKYDELVKENAALQQKHNDVLEVNNNLAVEIEMLSEANAKNAANPAAAVTKDTIAFKGLTFKHDKETYIFNHARATLGGKAITAEDVVASPELQQTLVDKQSGMISKKSK